MIFILFKYYTVQYFHLVLIAWKEASSVFTLKIENVLQLSRYYNFLAADAYCFVQFFAKNKKYFRVLGK